MSPRHVRKVFGLDPPRVIELTNVCVVPRLQKALRRRAPRRAIRQRKVQLEQFLLATPIWSPPELVIAEVADQQLIRQPRLARLLCITLRGGLEARSEDVDDRLLASAELLLKVQCESVRGQAVDLAVGPRADRVEAPGAHPVHRLLGPRILAEATRLDGFSIRAPRGVEDAVTVECHVNDAFRDEALSARILEPPDVAVLCNGDRRRADVGTGDTYTEHRQKNCARTLRTSSPLHRLVQSTEERHAARHLTRATESGSGFSRSRPHGGSRHGSKDDLRTVLSTLVRGCEEDVCGPRSSCVARGSRVRPRGRRAQAERRGHVRESIVSSC